MQAVLEMLAGPPPVPGAADIDGWLARLGKMRERWPRPIDRAIAAGFAADRLGYAFAGGYLAALEALAGVDRPAALCVTEAAGNHPRAIETRLSANDDGEGATLTGEKTFVTLGGRAEILLVAATAGTGPDGRPLIRLVSIDAASPGVVLEPAPATPFAPEIPHARARFEAVAVPPQPGIDEDGYPSIKAFRTVEDIHVMAAALGYGIGAARRRAQTAPLDRLLACTAGLWALGAADATAPGTHLALAGLHAAVLNELDEPAWLDGPEGDRFRRDRPLLHVAGKARALRAERARAALGGSDL